MKVSCQLHSPVLLLLGKELPVSIVQETGWAPESVCPKCMWKKEFWPVTRFCPSIRLAVLTNTVKTAVCALGLEWSKTLTFRMAEQMHQCTR